MPPDAPPLRVVSGGQTGVDRAALDVAMSLGLPCGGWVPRGRRAEDGRIADSYPVRETLSPAYAARTRLNVRDSDATLVLTRGRPTGGTALTARYAEEIGRPARVVDLGVAPDPAEVRSWMRQQQVGVLNVAGPRESNAPGIYAEATRFLVAVLGDGSMSNPER